MNRIRIDELNGKHGFEEWESIHTDTTTTNEHNRRKERHSVTNILLIVGVGALAVSVVVGVIIVSGAALTAWTYAKSPGRR